MNVALNVNVNALNTTLIKANFPAQSGNVFNVTASNWSMTNSEISGVP
jgi:hypothetical protein